MSDSRTSSELFGLGYYPAVIRLGDTTELHYWASLALIGQGDRALKGLEPFEGPEAEFYRGVAAWMEGRDQQACDFLKRSNLEHAQRLLELASKPKIKVLSQIARGAIGIDLIASVAKDSKFELTNLGHASDAIMVGPYASVTNFFDPKDPPDFYICRELEWFAFPKDMELLPCPKFGHTADLDLHYQAVLPWLEMFDEITVSTDGVWEQVSATSSRPVSYFPKVYGIPDDFEAITEVEKDIDLFISGTTFHPLHPDKATLMHQLLRMTDPEFNLRIGGFLDRKEFRDHFFRSKVGISYVRLIGGLTTRSLETLAAGSVLLLEEGNILWLYFGKEHGILEYSLKKDNIDQAIKFALENWPELKEKARRGAKELVEQFSMTRIASQYFRFLTFLAAKPRPVHQPKPRPDQVLKRGILWCGFFLGLPFYREAMGTSIRKWQTLREQQPNPRWVIDTIRELVLDYTSTTYQPVADLMEKKLGLRPQAVPEELQAALDHYRIGIRQFPKSLVLRVNMIRTELHLGNETECHEAIGLALETLAQPIDYWLIDPLEDIFPWDFFPEMMNYRDYFDLAFEGLVKRADNTSELGRLLYACLHYYLSYHRDPIEHAFQAHSYDHKFAAYGLKYARELIKRGVGGDFAQAGAVLLKLADDSILYEEAFAELVGLCNRGLFSSPKFHSIADKLEVAKARTFSVWSGGGSNWGEPSLLPWRRS